MRALSLACFVLTLGCGALRALPTTGFFAPLDPSVAPIDSDWTRLVARAPGTRLDGVTQIVAQSIGDEWLVWGVGPHERGTIVRALRTPLGLEAQSSGTHVGPCVRPTLRRLRVGDSHVVIVESSIDERSTDRSAWLYGERGSRLVPLALDDGTTRIGLRAERRTPLDGGWLRATTLTATIDASDDTLVVHEHASVREIADGRPEISARSAYEVERARTLRGSGDVLHADRPSLFGDGDATPDATGR